MKDFLPKYRESREFQLLMQWLKDQHRPSIPRYSPQGGEDQWETIKYATASQDGFDLLYSILTGDKE